MPKNIDLSGLSNNLLTDVSNLIESARQAVNVTVNSTLTLLYWQVGKRILEDALANKRGLYGEQTIVLLSKQLATTYGSGWSPRQLHICVQFAEQYPEVEIVRTLCAELSWSHIRILIRIDDKLKRSFYAEMSKLEHWNVRLLQDRINSMLYERTAISKKPQKTIENDLTLLQRKKHLTEDLVFRDPYILNFLGLKDTYSERDLETAIINQLKDFIIELGSDFAFLARQKVITIDNRDYKIDLLFFHRRLKCLIVIELKLGEFEAGNKGQMELYLRYVEKYESVEGENKPIGLILCAGKNQEHVELLQLEKSNIKVADYLTVLPPKQILLEKLHKAIEAARIAEITHDN